VSLLTVEQVDTTLVLTLNRPESLNAINVALHEELRDALKAARGPAVRAVVVTGAGRGFCVGQDLEEVAAAELTPAERIERYYNPNLRALRELPKPVIAAVNGPAAGAGLSIALACDLRIAASSASFVPAFAAIGLIPDSGASWTLVHTLGYARAFDWATSSRKMGAEEALAVGLVQEISEPETLMRRALERAAALAAMPGEGIAMTKRLMQQAQIGRFSDQLELERQLQGAASEHPDYLASVQAFLDKRARTTA
jgi:2-(1,2-epoxy-1,2-dihydrophenyl)acetyl-CoA isomerase